jgi:hypothetical protein
MNEKKPGWQTYQKLTGDKDENAGRLWVGWLNIDGREFMLYFLERQFLHNTVNIVGRNEKKP